MHFLAVFTSLFIKIRARNSQILSYQTKTAHRHPIIGDCIAVIAASKVTKCTFKGNFFSLFLLLNQSLQKRFNSVLFLCSE